jgi:hypothetical protein
MIQIKQDWIDFAARAAEHFAKHKEHRTFTTGEIESGCLFAVKWGLDNDCVLVFQLDTDPIIFAQIIKEIKYAVQKHEVVLFGKQLIEDFFNQIHRKRR